MNRVTVSVVSCFSPPLPGRGSLLLPCSVIWRSAPLTVARALYPGNGLCGITSTVIVTCSWPGKAVTMASTALGSTGRQDPLPWVEQSRIPRTYAQGSYETHTLWSHDTACSRSLMRAPPLHSTHIVLASGDSDWFTECPAEALKGVAMAMMTETDLELGDALEGIVEMFRCFYLLFCCLSYHQFCNPAKLVGSFAFGSFLDKSHCWSICIDDGG